MTRRSLIQHSPVLLAACAGCSPKRSEMRAQIDELGKDLVILTLGLGVSDVHGRPLGRLNLPEISMTTATVATDARCIAWVRGQFNGRSIEPGAGIGIIDDVRPPRKIPCEGMLPTQIAVSTNARHIALEWGTRERKMVLMNGETGLVEYDLTNLIRPITGEIYRLGITPDGSKLAVGSDDHFMVVDVPSGRSLLTVNGGCPALSPDGATVAFVDRKHRLILKGLGTGTERYPMKGWNTYGVGRWSPDGRFLLAGAWVELSLLRRLVAVDTRNGGFLVIGNLGEGDGGSRCAWVARQLIPV